MGRDSRTAFNERGTGRMSSIGANIKARRRELGMNQDELARLLGLTQANISRIEANAKGPSADMLPAIAEALHCDVRDLLGVERGGTEAGELDGNARTFVLKALESDPQLGMYLRSFIRDSDSYTDEDWKFLATSLKLALGYAADTIKARRVGGNF